jgi:hypothetical protein
MYFSDGFTSFQMVVYWDDTMAVLLGCVVFLSVMKLLKLLRFSRKITELISTLSLAKESISGFFLVLSLLMSAFSQFFYIEYGRSSEDYSTYFGTLETLFAMMMNRYTELGQQDKVLGPVFFVIYMFVVSFITMEIIVSVIGTDYSSVRTGTLTSSEYDMVEFMLGKVKDTFGLGQGEDTTRTEQQTISFLY